MMATLDLLGQRWTLRVTWELQQQPVGSASFAASRRDVLERAGQSGCAKLTELGTVRTDPDGVYHLTDIGDGLQAALEPLREWANAGRTHCAPTREASGRTLLPRLTARRLAGCWLFGYADGRS